MKKQSKPKARASMQKFKTAPGKKPATDKAATAKKGYRERADKAEL